MVANIELVVLSFFASLGFAIVFQIRGRDLVYAGLGGALTRIVFLILMAFIPYRLVYAGLAAMFAAFYAEAMGTYKKVPSTMFLYPSIIPLIPADLLYFAIGGLVLQEAHTFRDNMINCVLALIGISVGFVIASTLSHYVRRYHIFAGTAEWFRKKVFH